MSVKGIIMFLGMNNTRLETKILIILDFENGFLPTYLPLCILTKIAMSASSILQKNLDTRQHSLTNCYWNRTSNLDTYNNKNWMRIKISFTAVSWTKQQDVGLQTCQYMKWNLSACKSFKKRVAIWHDNFQSIKAYLR